jgi:superfamily II DNA helicase RecQ
LARTILAEGERYRGEKMRVSEELSNQLRQATGIAKAPYAAEFVRLLADSGEQIVLYGWHREVYSIWLDRLKEYQPRLYTGTENSRQKEEAKKAFLNGSCRILIISLRAGAGVDGLQSVCRTVVHGELDWSPGVHEQNAGRVYRDGQTEPVMNYFLVAETGSDPVIAERLGIKCEQIRGLRQESAELFEALQNDGGHIKRLAQAFLDAHEKKYKYKRPPEKPNFVAGLIEDLLRPAPPTGTETAPTREQYGNNNQHNP